MSVSKYNFRSFNHHTTFEDYIVDSLAFLEGDTISGYSFCFCAKCGSHIEYESFIIVDEIFRHLYSDKINYDCRVVERRHLYKDTVHVCKI